MDIDHKIEQQLIVCAKEYNEARYLWHHYMDEYIMKFGMPTLYVGCVNYAYDQDYNIEKVLELAQKYPLEKAEAYLFQEIEWLQKWIYPGKYTVALYPDLQKIHILGEQFGMKDVSSYAASNEGDNVLFAIRIKHSFFRMIRVPKKAKRAQTELKSILDACISKDGSSSSYGRLNEMKPIIDSQNKTKYLSFFGQSLGLPAKEFLYAVNQLDNTQHNLHLTYYSQGRLKISTDVEGNKIDWCFSHLYETHNRFVFDSIDGESDNIEGYENLRKVYDKLLFYMTQQFGEPNEQEDVPSNIRKASILKALREDVFEIKSYFKNSNIEASIEIIADDDEKKCGRIYIEAYDKRLQNINSAKYKSIKTNVMYDNVAAQASRTASVNKYQEKENTQSKNIEKEDDSGCLIATSIVVGIPGAAILAYLIAAGSVGDTSDEFSIWFTTSFIIFAIFLIPFGYFSAKYDGGKTYSSGKGGRSRGKFFLGCT